MSDIKHILVATDGSPCAERAFAKGVQLAVSLPARLTILAVVDPAVGRSGSTEDVEALGHEMEGRLKEFGDAAVEAGIRHVAPISETGIPYSRILRWADEGEVDLLVLGGNGWDSRAPQLGDVANHVVKFATCPVLIVR